MKKLFSFLFFVFFILKSFAQLDTEHWFAPMIDRTGNGSTNQTIYFSTNATTAFPVTIYNNNVVIGTVSVSKGNPQKFVVPRQYIITTEESDLFHPVKMGLYTKADQPYFANLRFSVLNHAEILTSKGKAGIGTKFYAAMAPISVFNPILNFMTSVLATEDNTNVTISGYKPNVVFSVPQTAPITFTLNKGESYIIDGTGDYFDNRTSFIGAKIVSDKPVSVTNGNFNGQYAGDYPLSSDILMDQSVPVERLGKEFAMLSGFGKIPTVTTSGNNMEGGVIVATENDTKIYVNDILAAVATLQEGEFYRLPESYYVSQSNGVYNMYINSTKNIYLYQLLAGNSSGNVEAAGGFNYIPPLSCYLPKTIDEIGLITENLTVSNDQPQGQLNIPTKLNIITAAGGTVTVNGSPLTAAEGPYPLIGNSSWVTYSKMNVTGNITVSSTKAVTAGIAAGDGAVGYGGYFAGFSSIPAIVKQSETCIPNLILEVTAGFDTYQWKLNDNNITGANLNTYTPLTPGHYTVTVSQGTCSPVTTAAIKILNCPQVTELSKSVCLPFTIIPKFTVSTQKELLSMITTNPGKGSVSVNPDNGIITYTPNAGASGADSFTYKFCGAGEFEDCEIVTVNITIGDLKTKDATLTNCKINGGSFFNLSLANVTVNIPVKKKYYRSLPEAQAEVSGTEINDYDNFFSTGGDVFAVIKTNEGCSNIAKITLAFYPEIFLDTTLYNAVNCDDDLDRNVTIDFSTITPVILQNAAYFQVRYYLNQADANAGNAKNLPNNYSYSSDVSVYVRVDSPDNCLFKVQKIDFKLGEQLSVNNPVTQTVCSESTDKNIVLSDYIQFFTTDTSVTAKYYKTLADARAQNSTAALSVSQSISKNETLYVRFSKSDFCDNIGTLNLIYSKPLKSETLPPSVIVCEGSTTVLDAGTSFTSYLWSTGETTQKITIEKGIYTVTLTSANTCSLTQSVEVKEQLKAVLTTNNYTAENCDDNFDGKIDIKFSDITPIILPNFTVFNVKYYSTQAFAQIGGNNNLSDNYSYSSNETVYVRVESEFCPPVIQPLNLKIGNALPLIKDLASVSECDDDLDNIKSADLSKYLKEFTTDSGVNVSYYDNLNNAKESQNPVSNQVSINKSGTYYFRLSKTGFCPVIATLNLKIDVPKASTLLFDQSICPGTKTVLDAGLGFRSYLWSTGEKTHSINASVGDYFVDLDTGNGCIYSQKVSVKEVVLPTIKAIDIKGTTVTITATGGNEPYYYSLNGSAPQTSNVFYDVKNGKNIIAVTSSDQCAPVTKEFSLISITNVITPNGDRFNDTFNYSDLKTKDNPKLNVFDRYGKLIFTGNESNNFTWDGTINLRKLPTDSYWYVLEWQEFGAPTMVKMSGWVLLKNTNF